MAPPCVWTTPQLLLLVVLCVHGAGAVVSSGSKKFYVNLTNAHNTAYYGTISVGRPPQLFKVIFSSGSSDTWLPLSSCASVACAVHSTYNPGSSSTFEASDVKYELEYSTGELSGDSGSDVWSIGNTVVKDVSFGQITSITAGFSKKFKWLPFDGVIGLGYPAGASSKLGKPLMDSLLEQDLVIGVFSLYLNGEPGVPGSTLVFGGTEDRFHTAAITYFPVETPHVFWMIAMHGVSVQEPVSSNRQKQKVVACGTAPFCHAVFDSGQSLISAPKAAFEVLQPLFDRLSPNNTCDPSIIATLPTLHFHFAAGEKKNPNGGKPFLLEPEDYVIAADAPAVVGGKACFVGITPLDLPESMGSTPMWVFGNVFLRHYYCVFDRVQNRIGLAPAAHSSVHS